jgi:hypothetical protein
MLVDQSTDKEDVSLVPGSRGDEGVLEGVEIGNVNNEENTSSESEGEVTNIM